MKNLHPNFTEDQKARLKLNRQVIRKSLDLVDEDGMNANVDNSSGLGWKEILALAACLGGGGFLAQTIMSKQAVEAVIPPVVEAVDPAPVQTIDVLDSEYEVLFYDAAGNQIDVSPLVD